MAARLRAAAEDAEAQRQAAEDSRALRDALIEEALASGMGRADVARAALTSKSRITQIEASVATRRLKERLEGAH